MLNRYILAFLAIIVSILSSCNDSQGLASIQYHKPVQLIDSRTIYEVINFCLKNKEIDWQCENLTDSGLYSQFSESDSLQILQMDTIFTKEDLQFMTRQMRYNRYFKISNKYVKGYKIISTDTLIYIKQKNREDGSDYYTDQEKLYEGLLGTIDLPVFSKNKKYCLVSISNNMHGASYILKRTGTTWKIIYKYGEWVS